MIVVFIPKQGAAGPDGAPGARGSSVSFPTSFCRKLTILCYAFMLCI